MIKIQNDDCLKMSKYKKIFSYTLNWSEQVFVSKKAENTVSWTFEIAGTFEREL